MNSIPRGERSPHLEPRLFFERNLPALSQLFTILDIDRDWDGSLVSAVELTQPWAKGDHFAPLNKTSLLADQAEAAHGVYQSMSLVESLPLAPRLYSQVIVLGALQRGNVERLSFLKDSLDSGVSVGPQGIVLWGGQRSRQEIETEALQNNVAKLLDGDRQTDSAWFRVQQKSNLLPSNETELLRAASLLSLGNMTLKQLHLRFQSPDPIQRYVFDNEAAVVTLLNTLAVQRENGAPRHTTEACANDWLDQMAPEQNSTVAFVTANPYLERTTRVVQSVLNERGRQDIQLVACGPAAYDNARDYLFLGEIARNLYEDAKVTS